MRYSRKLWFWLTALILVLALVAVACGDDEEEEAPPAATPTPGAATPGAATPGAATPGAATPTATPPPEPITIGVSLPLSGPKSEPGTAAKEGYEVWAELVNEAGGLLGRPVELIIVDNASDAQTIITDYERLITVDEVDLVVGPFSSALVIPSSEVAAKYGYAFIEPAGGAPEVFNRGLTNIFFAQPGAAVTQGDTFVDFLLSLPADQQPKTAAYITEDDPFTKSVIDGIKEKLDAAGVDDVLFETYPEGLTDFTAIAARVKDLEPDLIVGGTIFEDAVAQARAYQAVGYNPKGLFLTTGPSLPVEFLEALGDATEGIFAAVSWAEDWTTTGNQEMVAAYRAKFGPQPIAEDVANAFTVGQVLQQAVENIQSIDNAALIEELHRGTYDTVVGPLSFDEVGKPLGAFHTLQWQGGKIVIVLPPESPAVGAEPIWPKPEWP